MIINSILIKKDGSYDIRAIKFSASLDDWGDLAPGNVTFATDGGTGYWKPVISGPDGAVTSGDIPNVIAGRLRVGATGDHIVIDGDNQRIRSSNYVSGTAGSGFNLDADLLEVGNISARGLIRTAAFQKDVISAIGGNLLVRPADVLATDMSTGDASVMVTKGVETLAVNDILRIKDGTDDEWIKVANITSAPNYTVTRDQSSGYSANENPAWKKGATVVNYGQAGDGFSLLTASESNSPRISIATHAGAPWTSQTEHLRLGNLNGFLGYSSDVYGIGIGATTAYLKYEPVGGMQYVGPVNDRTPWVEIASTHTDGTPTFRYGSAQGMTLNKRYSVDTAGVTTGYTFALLLRDFSPEVGDWVSWIDVSRNFSVVPLRLASGTDMIEGYSDSSQLYVDCTWDRANGTIVWTGALYGWKLL